MKFYRPNTHPQPVDEDERRPGKCPFCGELTSGAPELEFNQETGKFEVLSECPNCGAWIVDQFQFCGQIINDWPQIEED